MNIQSSANGLAHLVRWFTATPKRKYAGMFVLPSMTFGYVAGKTDMKPMEVIGFLGVVGTLAAAFNDSGDSNNTKTVGGGSSDGPKALK
jgi:hypothetical protein